MYDLVRAPVRPGRRVRRGTRVRDHPGDRRGRRATTTPTSSWSCAPWPRCGSPIRALESGRTRWLVLSGMLWAWLRDEDGRGAVGRPGDRRRVVVGRPSRPL